jgi:hypothetical protein
MFISWKIPSINGKNVGLFHGKSQSEMDDNWGNYPHDLGHQKKMGVSENEGLT